MKYRSVPCQLKIPGNVNTYHLKTAVSLRLAQAGAQLSCRGMFILNFQRAEAYVQKIK